MTTEKLAKGFLTLPGGPAYPKVHDAFVKLLLVAKNRPEFRAACGFSSYSAFNAYLTSLLPLASAIENLSPEGGDHPNPEYPWEEQGRVLSPLTYPFPGLDFQHPRMVKLLRFLADCFTLI